MTFIRSLCLLSAFAAFMPSPSYAETATAFATPNGSGVQVTHSARVTDLTRCSEADAPMGATLKIGGAPGFGWTNASSFAGGMGTWEFKVGPENTTGLEYKAMENGVCVTKTIPLSQMEAHKLYKYDLAFPLSLIPSKDKPSSTQKGGKITGSMMGATEAKLFITYENVLPEADSVYVDGNTINFTFR